jgi:CotH kinase protein/Secretion system C-terminal sorting domain
MRIKIRMNFFIVACLFLGFMEMTGQNRDTLSRGISHGTSDIFHPIKKSTNSTTVRLDSSNLPIILIDTRGQTIPDEPKITARMKIINYEPQRRNRVTDPGNIYDGYVGIEIRGSYSATLPQKPYGFETRDSLGNNLNVPLLNMPAENDWVLIANYNDKVFMRNTLAFDLFAKMGHYQPHTQLCELDSNGVYEGIYVLTEKIKQDKNRVNISKLEVQDTLGDNLTGGYIIKVDNTDGSGTDFWNSKYEAIDCPGTGRYPYFVYSYPKPEDIVTQQKKYIQGYVARIDSMLRTPKWADPVQGYGKYLDVSSFIDYCIVGEVSRNVDTYKKSAFFYKDKDSKDGRLHNGPVWDFDWAWKNINECEVNAIDGSGWTYLISSVCKSYPVPPGWMVKLLQDTNFTNQLHTRYSLLRKTILSVESLNRYIDSIHTLVNEAQVRHYQRWPILGINVGTPEVDAQPSTFDGEITKFKKWISTRLTWLDANMPGKIIQSTAIQGAVAVPKDFVLFQNYPNPFNPTTVINYQVPVSSHVVVKVYDMLGRDVATLVNEQKSAGSYQVDFDAHLLTSGVYFYSLQSGSFAETKKLILIK